MKMFNLAITLTLVGMASAACNTASTDSNYVCMITGAGINVHWKTFTAGNYYEMMVDAPQAGANGYAAVGWNPTNPTGNKMIGSTILMGGTADLNSVKMYSPADTVQANILATEAAVPATITQTAINSANGRITLKFRRSGVSSGNLLTIFAFGNTGTLSYHATSKSSATINLDDGVAVAPTPPAACNTASTDSNYVCMITGAGINVHWKTVTAGNYYEMMVDAPQAGANGFTAVGWNPTNPTGNKMIGSTILMGGTADLNSVKMYSPADTVQANILATEANQANILATEAAVPATITQTAIASANGRIILKFRRSGVSSGNLLTIFAFGNTGTLSYHGNAGKSSATINLDHGVAVTPTPPTLSCTASTLIQTGTTTYDCMHALSTAVTIHWNRETSGTAAVAATTTSVNGWFSVSFPQTAGSMSPATAVATSSATTAGIYSITARSAAGITATTSTDIDTPTTEVVNGLRILRFNAKVSFLTASKPMNFAYHSTDIQFPVAKHTTKGSGNVNFVSSTPAPVAATPVPQSCVASTLIVSGTTTYDCMLALTNTVTIHWNRETSSTTTMMAATASAVTGWLAIGFPTTASSMAPATAVASNGVTGGVYSITGKSASAITATTSPNLNTVSTEAVNGQRVIRFVAATSFLNNNMAINYAFHSTEPQFPVSSAQHTSRGSSTVDFVSGTAQVVVGEHNFDDARTHGGAMIFIWAYWVPLAMFMKGVGPLFLKGKVGDFPIPFVIHTTMMVIAMILTTVFAAMALEKFHGDTDYSHRELGIAILAIGWVQVLGGIAKPGNDSSFRKYWGMGHMFMGTTILLMAIFQMFYGIENVKDLYPIEDSDPFLAAVIAGLAGILTFYIIGKIYVGFCAPKEEKPEDKENASTSSSNEPDNEKN
eukprot:TRINITY_DN692_c0_g1_i8.p1 TRINITY_DN692_c0_g1~~TRINITY_DN692_c0_g1_i8.p1  ORF type:complete len:893 (+),score=193.31 TRINITY_DN692_c0_g1_i8:46-2724(+)